MECTETAGPPWLGALGTLLPSLLLVAALTAGCSAAGDAASRAGAEEPPKPELVGELTRDRVEAAVPDWVAAEVAANPDPAAVQALAAVPPGAELVIYLGTWCPDSRREVSHFWRVLDEAGGELPFTVRYVGVNRAKSEPAELVSGADLRYVPTFVVRRRGEEVGRIVEQPPRSVEEDLLALLTGEATGLLSGSRPELQAADGGAPELRR